MLSLGAAAACGLEATSTARKTTDRIGVLERPTRWGLDIPWQSVPVSRDGNHGLETSRRRTALYRASLAYTCGFNRFPRVTSEPLQKLGIGPDA